MRLGKLSIYPKTFYYNRNFGERVIDVFFWGLVSALWAFPAVSFHFLYNVLTPIPFLLIFEFIILCVVGLITSVSFNSFYDAYWGDE